jgi:hypothetical protein
LDRGSCLLSSNLRPFHDELVEGVRVPLFLLPLLFSILVDLVRCGLSPLACLVFVALLILLPLFSSMSWQVDQREVNLEFPSFGTIVLKLLYACTFFVHR